MRKSYKHETAPNRIVAMRRSDLSLTQAELASKLGYPSVNFISMIEHGQSEVPIGKVGDVAAVLEMDAKWFAEQVLRARHSEFADILLGPRSGDVAA